MSSGVPICLEELPDADTRGRREFTIAVLSPVWSRSAGLVTSAARCDEMLRLLLTICDLFPLLLIPLNSWRFLTQLACSQSSIYEQIRVSSWGP